MKIQVGMLHYVTAVKCHIPPKAVFEVTSMTNSAEPVRLSSPTNQHHPVLQQCWLGDRKDI